MGFAHCSETWLDLPHLPENLGKGPNIGSMQHFRNATSGRFIVNMWVNNCERNCLSPRFLKKLLQVTYVLQSLLLNKKNSFFDNSSFSFHSMIK